MRKDSNIRNGKEAFQVQTFILDLLDSGILCFLNGVLAAFNEKVWVLGKKAVMAVMAKTDRSLSVKNLNDAISFAEILGEDPPEEYLFQDDPYLIACSNGVLDLRTFELLEFSSSLHCCMQIPWDWNPDAKSPVLDKFLADVTLGDQKKMDVLISCVASILFRQRIFQVIWILHGEGANGKSVFMDMVTSFIGKKNCSSVSIAQLSNRFGASSAMNHLLNANADIESETISAGAQAIMKNMASGDAIEVEAKGKDLTGNSAVCPILLYACNNIPLMSDRTEGFSRRLRLVLFPARFTPDDPGFDPFIGEKLKSREVMEALFVKSIAMLNGLLVVKKIPETEEMRQEKDEYKMSSSSVLSFFNEIADYAHDLDVGFGRMRGSKPLAEMTEAKEILMALPISTVYKEMYVEWCKSNGCLAVRQTKFSLEVKKKYNLKSEPRYACGKTDRYYCEC